jgi:hypothetical protein
MLERNGELYMSVTKHSGSYSRSVATDVPTAGHKISLTTIHPWQSLKKKVSKMVDENQVL